MKKGKYPESTNNSNKLLVFVNIRDIDEVWASIEKAVEEGKLDVSAEVATAKLHPLATSSGTKLICAYNYDWTDEKCEANS